MRRLAGYLVFCWLAIAFYTLSGATNWRGPALIAVGLIVACSLSAAVGVLRGRSRAARRPREPSNGRFRPGEPAC